jgi:hypothetical protein
MDTQRRRHAPRARPGCIDCTIACQSPSGLSRRRRMDFGEDEDPMRTLSRSFTAEQRPGRQVASTIARCHLVSYRATVLSLHWTRSVGHPTGSQRRSQRHIPFPGPSSAITDAVASIRPLANARSRTWTPTGSSPTTDLCRRKTQTTSLRSNMEATEPQRTMTWKVGFALF